MNLKVGRGLATLGIELRSLSQITYFIALEQWSSQLMERFKLECVFVEPLELESVFVEPYSTYSRASQNLTQKMTLRKGKP
ncbi:UNVERIFIED_CONTAM: hypothetical protein NCL1_36172 [Trichonephila clavipes]